MPQLTEEEIPKSLRAVLRRIVEEKDIRQPSYHIETLSSGASNFMGDLLLVDVRENGHKLTNGNHVAVTDDGKTNDNKINGNKTNGNKINGSSKEKTKMTEEDSDDETREVKEGKELNLFVKFSNVPVESRGEFPVKLVYEREYLTYTELGRLFAELQDRHGVPQEERFRFAKFYGGTVSEVPDVIVLENLKKRGYCMPDRRQCMTWDYAKKAIRELARFHSLSFALKAESPQLFEQHIKGLDSLQQGRDPSSPVVKALYTRMKDSMLSSVPSRYHGAIERFSENLPERVSTYYSPGERGVLVHGDFRQSNHMVRYSEGSVDSLITLDFQTIHHGNPVLDLFYFLFTSADSSFRREHYEQCLSLYHDTLSRSLSVMGVDVESVYPERVFREEMRDKLLYALFIGMFVLQIVLVEEAAAPKLVDLVGDTGAPMKFGNDLYGERMTGILEDLVQWGALTI